MIFVLDACAMIAWLRDEPGADVVDAAVRDINSQCLAHSINLCEVFYIAYRNAGEAHAQSIRVGSDCGARHLSYYFHKMTGRSE
jgi:hypothetical protein